MTARPQVTLRVELDSQGDSISGRVLDQEGAGTSFLGWVGLAAAIEAVTGASAQHMDRRHEEESRQWTGATVPRGANAPPTTPRQTAARQGQEER